MLGAAPYSGSLSECQPMASRPSLYRFSRHELNRAPASASMRSCAKTPFKTQTPVGACHPASAP